MSGRDRNDDNRVSDVIDAIEGAADIIRRNQDLLDDFVGGGGEEQLELREPLSDAQVNDDEVIVVAELKNKKPEEMGVRFEDGVMYLTIGDLTLRARVPDDVVQESVEATMNNGVLRVSVDRANTDNMNTVNIERKEDESIKTDQEVLDEIKEESEDDEGGDEDGTSR